jgi:acetylornithine/N-succinyldiaminopimelate aminotransferase
MKKTEIFESYQKYILSTYTRTPVIFVKGKGMTMTDIDGKKYLDFFPGWGVSNLGHCHPKVMSGVRDQIGKLIHIPNNFYHPQQAKLAKEIIRVSFPGKVFFCNSGAEANEAAIKLARAYGKGRYEIISMAKSFHGRTLAALTATGQTKYQEGFGPLVEGFKIVPFNDLNALKAAITDKTVAIMFELVQGEGGINIADKDYVQAIRKLCDEKNILMILDEVQTGIGRTGEMFAFQNYGIVPDVVCLAKALGGGLPIGAMVVAEKFTDTFKPGMHASTFGGSPLVCKAAIGVLKALAKKKLFRNANVMGAYIQERLNQLKEKHALIKDVRGLGLMIGIELGIEGKAVVEECLAQGLIINCTQGNVLRIMPALDVTKKQIDKALYILEGALNKVQQGTNR